MSCNSNSDYTNNLKKFENRKVIITKLEHLLMNTNLRKVNILNLLWYTGWEQINMIKVIFFGYFADQ